jgi:hypothetical protein
MKRSSVATTVRILAPVLTLALLMGCGDETRSVRPGSTTPQTLIGTWDVTSIHTIHYDGVEETIFDSGVSYEFNAGGAGWRWKNNGGSPLMWNADDGRLGLIIGDDQVKWYDYSFSAGSLILVRAGGRESETITLTRQ